VEADRRVKCTVNTSTLRTIFFILHVNDYKRGVKTCEIFDKFSVAQICENYAQNLCTKFLMCVVCTAHNIRAATSPNLYNDVILPSVLS